MNRRITKPCSSKTLGSMSLGLLLAIVPSILAAEAATQPAPRAAKARADRQAIQQEIARQPEGIHTLSDGSVCIKSGRGLAHIHDNGRGCGTGLTPGGPPPADDDVALMAGIFAALILNPQDGTAMGISPALAKKLVDAHNYMDHQGTDPSPVLKLYDRYSKAGAGQPKIEAEAALMDRVRAVGQAYLDVESKKLKDVKSMITPEQSIHLRAAGMKMIRPFEKPVA